MVLELQAAGTGTLTASGPGTVPSVTVSEATASTDDIVLLTPTAEVKDVEGTFQLYVDSIDNGVSFTVKSREQLPEDLTFNYCVFDAA